MPLASQSIHICIFIELQLAPAAAIDSARAKVYNIFNFIAAPVQKASQLPVISRR
jgi:hypothetical protein